MNRLWQENLQIKPGIANAALGNVHRIQISKTCVGWELPLPSSRFLRSETYPAISQRTKLHYDGSTWELWSETPRSPTPTHLHLRRPNATRHNHRLETEPKVSPVCYAGSPLSFAAASAGGNPAGEKRNPNLTNPALSPPPPPPHKHQGELAPPPPGRECKAYRGLLVGFSREGITAAAERRRNPSADDAPCDSEMGIGAAAAAVREWGPHSPLTCGPRVLSFPTALLTRPRPLSCVTAMWAPLLPPLSATYTRTQPCKNPCQFSQPTPAFPSRPLTPPPPPRYVSDAHHPVFSLPFPRRLQVGPGAAVCLLEPPRPCRCSARLLGGGFLCY